MRAITAVLEHVAGPPISADWDKDWAVIAHWSDGGAISRSVHQLVSEFHRGGVDCVIVSSASRDGLVEAESHAPVYWRPNLGYDFGSWATAMEHWPDLMSCQNLFLVNDSMLGPFADLRPLLATMRSRPVDVVGLVGTLQDRPHMQSAFTLFRGGVIESCDGLRQFWDGVEDLSSKREVIERYELGLARAIMSSGLTWSAIFPGRWFVYDGQNPSIQGWRRMLMRGFPFLKRELLLAPPAEVPDVTEVPEVVRAMFDENVMDWL